MKKYLVYSVVAVLSISLSLCGCKKDEDTENSELNKEVVETVTDNSDNEIRKLTENHIDAVINLTNGEKINIELYPDLAPKTVANFIKNVQENFYAGTIFHRAISGFVVQCGGYDTNYNLKSVSETVEGEFESNGYENPLSHERGVLSMARIPSQPNSATTQFFIVQGDSQYLDGDYAAFGKVKTGMVVVDNIANSGIMENPPSGMQDVPEEQFIIESIEIENQN